MTKEQILIKHDNGIKYLSPHAAYKAMDEYAKQECMELIAFMYASCAEKKPGLKWHIDLVEILSFEELYNKFNSQNTDK